MSTYYSLAIQRHPDSVEAMKKEIWACFYHKISTDTNPQHQYCDKSWCKYLQHQAQNEQYSHKPPLDIEIQQIIRPVYESLTSNELLERCLSKNTQNNNESFNKSIWQLAPKHIFSGKKVIEISAYVSACIFNEGRTTLLKILDLMGVTIGSHAVSYVKSRDQQRITEANRRSIEASKETRSQRKKEKADLEQNFEEAEGLLYGAGIAE